LEEFYWWFVGRRSILKGLLSRNPSGGKELPALDVGCGPGGMLLELQRSRPTVGLDLSLEALKFARGRGCRWLVRGDAQKLPVKPNSFGLITALDLLEHLEDDLRALKEMRTALAPGGKLLLTVPALKFLWSEHDEALGHKRRYSISELRRKVREAGFEIERLTYAIFLLLPPTALFRLAQRLALRRKRPRTALIIFPRPINAMFAATLFVEAHLLGHFNLPMGVSLVCVARKPKARS